MGGFSIWTEASRAFTRQNQISNRQLSKIFSLISRTCTEHTTQRQRVDLLIDTFVSTSFFNDFSISSHNFSVIIYCQRMLIPKTLRLNRFLLVMDELDLDAQFVRQFENRNFRLLVRFIFLVIVSNLIGNCP